jgi:hypothetical protein
MKDNLTNENDDIDRQRGNSLVALSFSTPWFSGLT